MPDDALFMKLAIAEALKGQATAAPNPIVGAVIVEDGEVVAAGFHVRPTEAHAEVIALKNLGRPPKPGATMYVTLEPCSTAGRTGACTEVLKESGITEIVLGAVDPNPDHRGRGITLLREAGINVRTGVLEQECTDLNPDFNERMTNAQKE